MVIGKFNVSQDEFLFVYQTFENTYSLARSNILASDGLYKLKSIIESFTFEDDQLTHTLASSSDSYTEINYILYPTLKKMFQQTYMPLLAEWTKSFFQPMIRRQMSNNASLYLQKTLDQLMQQVVGYLHRRNSTQIHIPPLTYSNNRTRVYDPLRFENITLEGLLNYEKYDVVHSTTPSVNNSLIVYLQDEIAIDYPVEGDKSAYFDFTFRAGKRKSHKKFKISKISIKMKREMLLDQYPPRINPLNVDGYQFLIEFQVVDFDETYIFMLNYLNHRISKVVTNAIKKNEFL